MTLYNLIIGLVQTTNTFLALFLQSILPLIFCSMVLVHHRKSYGLLLFTEWYDWVLLVEQASNSDTYNLYLHSENLLLSVHVFKIFSFYWYLPIPGCETTFFGSVAALNFLVWIGVLSYFTCSFSRVSLIIVFLLFCLSIVRDYTLSI